MTRLWATLFAAALGAAALTACRVADADPVVRGPVRFGNVALPRDSDIVRMLVPPRTPLAALLSDHQVIDREAAALVRRISEQFDLRRFRAGQPFRLDRFLDGRVREFEYEIDGDRRLIARRDRRSDGAFETEVAEIPKARQTVVLEGQIDRDTPSLIAALGAAARALAGAIASTPGDDLALALSLADIFSGEVDFSNDLQPGDTFRLLVDRATRDDGLFGGYGPVLAAELVNEGRRLRALRFTLADQKTGYFDEQGRSLKRFFLKSPLKFDPRITSGFSRARLHPVLDYVRAHNGVDYAAPTGAPVGAVAAGTVSFTGWTSGGGGTVKLRHASGYESEYLHLSAIARGLRAGGHVAQGELVGRVGATGLATGPHLHYGLKRNGTYVNPVREHRATPPGEPVPVDLMTAFNGERDRLLGLMFGTEARRAN